MIPENSIANTFPQLAQEWASDLNTNIDPLSLLPGSDKKVWWRCSQGHEWETRVNVRTLLRKSCPVCANNMVYLDDYNIMTIPAILKLWDADNNLGIKPEDVYISSNIDMHWKCRYGHRWVAPPSRVFASYRKNIQYNHADDFACIKCARLNRPHLPKIYLAVAFPDLLAEWDWEKTLKLDITLMK